MILPITAIDLLDGRCVRLSQGEYDKSTVYGDDPVAMALKWQSQGAKRLHVVDLNGAREGSPCNHDVIAAIANALDIPVQVGGGIREADTIEKLLSRGVNRCILGTRAAIDPAWAQEIFLKFGDKLILGVDAKNGQVAVKGWQETVKMTATELALSLKPFGACRVIYTDISRDGMLTGPNIPATAQLAQDTGMAIIASGGMSKIEDIRQLSKYPGIEGAIIGRALYTGDIDLAEVVAEFG